MARIVIIGAGLTGLSAAYHLEQCGITDYVILEQESTPGGLCRSHHQDGFIFDYTGHLLHTNSAYFSDLLAKLFSKNDLTPHVRNAAIYSHNRYTSHPYQHHLYGLPKNVTNDCITGFDQRPNISSPTTYREWVLTHFGTGLGTHFFFPYQQKLFDYPLEKITPSWTGRFVPSLTRQQIITGSTGHAHKLSSGYNARFWYPTNGGIANLIHAFTRTLSAPIKVNYHVKLIDVVRNIIHCSNGYQESYETIISTMPLDRLLTSVTGNSTAARLGHAATNLSCTSVINLNLGITKELPPYHWVYYPEQHYPFYRIGLPHRLTPAMAPAHHTSLSLEIAHHNRSHSWQNNQIKKALLTTKKLFGLTDNDIVTQNILRIPHAYVIYDHWRDTHLNSLKKELEQFAIITTGRYGGWRYDSMQEAVLAGKHIAEKLVSNPSFFSTAPNKTSLSKKGPRI